LYKELLQRSADIFGLMHYTSLLVSGKMTIEDIRNSLMDSEEYKKIH
jgi:hypothetical protein